MSNEEDPTRVSALKARESEIDGKATLVRGIELGHVLPNNEVKYYALYMTDLSVDREALVKPPVSLARLQRELNKDDLTLGRLEAGLCRTKNLVVAPDEVGEDTVKGTEANPAHAVVYGKKNKAVQKFLAANCRLLTPEELGAGTPEAGAGKPPRHTTGGATT